MVPNPISACRWLGLIACLLLTSTTCVGQVEFRAIGGPGIDRGHVVLPHEDGAFLLGSTQPEEVDLLRPYVVHYGNDLTVDWSVVLPSTDALEWVVDAKLNDLNEAQILTQRLTADGTYAANIHVIGGDGTLMATNPLDGVASNFIPAKLCDWQGSLWVVGHSGNRLVAADETSSTVLEWGGIPGQEDFIADVLVKDNILIAVGKRMEDGTSTGAIWGVYPLGQLAFEIIDPDGGDWTESQMDAIDVRGNSIRVLRTYRFNDGDGTSQTTHDFLGLNVSGGSAGAYWPGGLGQEGRDLIWTDQGVAKLLKSGNVDELDQSFLIAHISAGSNYIDQGHFGTSFEEDPSRLAVGPDGKIWAAGSTRGVLDGSWSACILRLDSLGPLGDWSNEPFGFGVMTDPNLLSWNALSEPAETNASWACHPNPAVDQLQLTVPDAFQLASSSLSWVIRDAGGRIVLSGTGTEVDATSLRAGNHTLEGVVQGQRFALPFMKVSH